MTRCTLGDTYVFFYFPKFDRNRGSHWMHFCPYLSHHPMFSCLQIDCQPFYLLQLLKFHPFDWLIEIYLQTEGQGTHHKMVSLQPKSGFPPMLHLSSYCNQFHSYWTPGGRGGVLYQQLTGRCPPNHFAFNQFQNFCWKCTLGFIFFILGRFGSLVYERFPTLATWPTWKQW